jgi:nitrite reductase/ring-hydroxylating ferredoxin subunit
LKLGDDFYAYRHLCPGCGESLEEGGLNDAELTCSGCSHRYDVRRAGRCLDDPQLHLEPIPLLVDEVAVEERQGRGQRSIVKIALPSAVG